MKTEIAPDLRDDSIAVWLAFVFYYTYIWLSARSSVTQLFVFEVMS